MGRKSEMVSLVDTVEASAQAKKRAGVILQTLAREYSVQRGCETLGMGRTRFQDLRRRMVRAAVGALEERPIGRPRLQVARTCRQLSTLRRRLSELEYELKRSETELDIARGDAGPAVRARLTAREGKR
jgi:hypothetical protein